jgi:hypothetical protein
MRAKVTWLILTAVTAVVLAGVVDAVRGSSSNPEAAQARGDPPNVFAHPGASIGGRVSECYGSRGRLLEVRGGAFPDEPKPLRKGGGA